MISIWPQGLHPETFENLSQGLRSTMRPTQPTVLFKKEKNTQFELKLKE